MTKQQLFRKTLYSVVAALLGALAIAGVITGEQANSWGAIATQIFDVLVPVIGTGSLALAATKVHRGSDSLMTETEVNKAFSKGEAHALVDSGVVVNPGEPVTDEEVAADVDTTAQAGADYRRMTRDNSGGLGDSDAV